MVKRPRISILMPTHSRVDVIGFAIQSVLSQTFADFELLIVGDGCPSESEGVIARFSDPRIRFFNFPKAPHFGYANRNAALREARGEFIGFAADDDLLFPDHLERLMKELEIGGALAYSQALWVSTDGIAAPFLTNLTVADELYDFMRRRNSIPASCFLYRADSLPVLDVWPEDVRSSADWHLWRRIIRENAQHPVSYCRSPTVLHFSAKWRSSRHAGIGQFATLLELADQASWWPLLLRVPIPEGATEQQVYSTLMQQDPTGWSVHLRQAAADLVARLAWEDIQVVRPELIAATEALATSQREILLLKKRDNEAEKRLSTVTLELTDTQIQLERRQLKLQDAYAKIEQYEQQLAEVNVVIKQQKNQLNGLCLDIERLRGMAHDAERRTEALRGEIAKLRSSTCWRAGAMLKGLRSVFQLGRR